ncbi:copper resistance protein NlpE [Luteimonas sp. e5]
MQLIRTSLLAAAVTLALAACQKAPDTAAPAAPAEAQSDASAAAPAASPAADAGTRAGVPAANDLVGTYSATLPCASCPGIDTTLTLEADGRYRLREVYQGQDGAPVETVGKWEIDDGKLELDPDADDETDREFAIDSVDALTLLGQDDRRAESGLDYTLKRQR